MEKVNKVCGKCFRFTLFRAIILILIICLAYTVFKFRNYESFSTVGKQNRTQPRKKTSNNVLLSVSNVKSQMGVSDSIDVIISLTKAQFDIRLQNKFKTCVKSLFHFSSTHVSFHIIGDNSSKDVADEILKEFAEQSKYKVHHINVDTIAKQAFNVVSNMQEFFSFKPGAYYSDSIFFLSIIIHRILPHMKKVIMLDADLKFNADINELYDEFKKFSESNIIGIARENQPVYRHAFHIYRRVNENTRVGEPPPKGLTGFNSGVLLLDVQKMANFKMYNSLLSHDAIKRLTETYSFKGHLGDQDFFTLLSLEYEEMFRILPCTWNRQLCVWWRDNGYKDVFEQYFRCDGHINIYHGNCNTEIPKLDWEK